MSEVKDKNIDNVVDATAVANEVDGYYGEELEMDGDLDLSFLDDEKIEPRDRDSYDD